MVVMKDKWDVWMDGLVDGWIGGWFGGGLSLADKSGSL